MPSDSRDPISGTCWRQGIGQAIGHGLRCAVVVAALLGGWGLPLPAQAGPRLTLQQHRPAPVIAARPDWPTPQEPGQVFFIQRSMNPNTVVYAARFTDAGGLNPHSPVTAYWRRYNDAGERKPLKGFERRLAYGMRSTPMPDGAFRVRFAALPDLPLILRPEGAGRAALWYEPASPAPGTPPRLRLDRAYLELDQSGLIPRVTRMHILGPWR